MKNILLIIIPVIFLLGCESGVVYQNKQEFDKHKWYIDSTASFSFKIKDTTSSYNVYYIVRNTINYPYNNLYVTYTMKDSSGKKISKDMHEMQLMDPATGKPYGDGIGDIFDHEILALKHYHFPYKGKYHFSVKQYMREDPLREIMAFGIKIKEAKKQ